ncbi:hypothetical protein BDN72DRAFT_961008 [Pluteus cervinus]|uniref:Uncharacterized protein n=1 Tax=Pluteus cervinus TaxID=181527 RepID=A0ACD3AP57_9AGAR|nr:hypothetical protein BDN72DRAFT_961008 [Pluteus cervinus]
MESLDPALRETATYQALHNELIFSHICELIRVEDGYTGWFGLAFRLLSSLARTCQAFSPIALGAIWRDLDTLFPLVKTMPTDCWEIVHSRSEHARVDNIHKLRFTRPITASDCERFRFYAPFVRTILNYARRARSGTVIVDPNVFQFLGVVYRRSFQSEPLLPSLDDLHWSVMDDLVFPHFVMLLNPNLREISIGLNGDVTLRLFHLTNVAVMCPELKSLTIFRCEDPIRMAAISYIFCSLPRLQTLWIEAVSTDTFIRFSKHQELAKLTLNTIDTIDWDVVETKLQGMPAFPSLKQFQVDSITVAQCRQVLQTTHSSLRSIELSISDCHTGSSYYRVLTAIKDYCPCELQKISLSSFAPDGNDFNPSVDPLLPDNLVPLFAFPNLTHLSIRPSSDFRLDDHWIQKMAENLPNIRSFFLISHNSEPGVAIAPTLSINCLVHFSLNCPHLEELGLAFDARHATLPGKASRRPTIHPTRVEVVYVGHSPLWDAYTVGAIFSDWFPKIYCISAGPIPGSFEERPITQQLQQMWHEVRNTIPIIRKIRNQERRGIIEKLGREQNNDGNAALSANGSDDAMDVDG